MALLPIAAWGQTPAGTPIDNTALATYDAGLTQPSNTLTITVDVLRTASSVEFLQYAPGAPGATTLAISTTECSASGTPAGPFGPVPGPTELDGTPIPVPGPVDLLAASEYTLGAPVFLQLTDGDANRDSGVVETVLLTLTVPGTGDSELVRLTETAAASGVFAGYIQSSGAAAVANDCVLEAAEDEQITASYVDAFDAADISLDSALISPLSVILDSSTGQLLSGASITLIDDGTGLPATTVLGDDGISGFPATVISGGTATDTGGTVYNFPPGSYRFPLVAAGTYRLDIVPAAGFLAPSVVATAVLQSLPGAPFSIALGSRGELFTVVTDSAIDVDIPLDPASTQAFLAKTASADVVGAGDFLQYNLRVRNPGIADAPLGLLVTDVLPVGFRYQAGSIRIDGAPAADPALSSDGRTLTFTLGTTPLPVYVNVRYVVQVSTGAPLGRATNRATSQVIGGAESYTATATVVVRQELFSDRTFLMGHVSVGSCGAPPDPDIAGLEGVRVYLENGTYAVTDKRGLFHFEGLAPRVHVVQVDVDTLPPQYEPVLCHPNSRFAGRSFSQFVDVRAGTLWRTDFRVKLRDPDAGYVNHQLHSELQNESLSSRIQIRGSGVPVRRLRAVVMLPEGARYVPGSSRLDGEPIEDPSFAEGTLTYALGEAQGRWSHDLELRATLAEDTKSERLMTASFALFETPTRKTEQTPVSKTVVVGRSTADSGVQLVETLGLRPGDAETDPSQPESEEPPAPVYDAEWLERAGPELEWLLPEPDFAPRIPSVKIAIKHDASQELVLLLNGERVSPLNFEDRTTNAAKSVAISRWRGVDLREGPNLFEARTLDPNGELVAAVDYAIHFSGPPVVAEWLPERSRPVADGRHPPVLAVQLRDRWGEPVREGSTGELHIELPHRPLQQREAYQTRQLEGLTPDQPSYVVGADGVARIELEPTTETGRVRLRLALTDAREAKLSTWLEPEDRDWVLVGVAEGTLAYNHLSGNMETLEELDIENHGNLTERVSLFAKGRIKGKWLLTLGYDSKGKTESEGESLGQLIDPDTYYTLYGSTAQQDYEAPTSKKLYVKLEQKAFYALFGDYDTGLDVTELSRYSRSFTGIKSEYDGDRFGFSAFLTETDQGFIRDDIRGDGTSGLYRLTRRDLVRNSEKIRIEVRDRFKTERVLSSEEQTRHLDYNIDYDAGTLYFKSPVASKDANLNPIFIVAEYEAEDDKDDSAIAGGRAAVKFLDDRLELGASAIHEGNTGRDGELLGLDFRYDLGGATQLRAELAQTDTHESGLDRDGVAYLAELATTTKRLDARAYVREQEPEFGLGQQSQTEEATRKLGAEASFRLTDAVILSSEAYRQTNLDTSRDRDVLEARTDYLNRDVTLFGGYRLARDRGGLLSDDLSQQVLAGGSWTTLERRMRLRLNTETSVGGDDENSDFPTRAILGADYDLMPGITVFAEQEFAFGERQDSRGTRMGLQATPWQGGQLNSSLEQRMTEFGERTFANLGLAQTWNVTGRWSVDALLDHTHTLRDPGDVPFNPDVPLTSGTLNDDFTAVSLGSTLRGEKWSWAARLETRFGELEDKWGLFTGFHREINDGLGYAVCLEYFDTDADSGVDRTEGDLKLNLVYRPVHSRWLLLNRTDLVFERQENASGGTFEFENRKLVNNLHLNYKWTHALQISLQYASKYVLDTIDSERYDGYIDIWGLELRRDLGDRWDLGLAARFKHSWEADLYESAYGIELGYQLATNLWISGGYNFAGFRDDDFGDANYTHQGPYLKFRYKFDQETIRDLLEWE